MKIYIAGPMRGHPNNNHESFDQMADRLRARGHEIVSPADLDRARGPFEQTPYTMREVMHEDLILLLGCDAVVMLPGWLGSRGARLERVVAESTNRMVFEFLYGELVPARDWHHELIFD